MVHHIKLYEDKELKKELKTLGTLQDADIMLRNLKLRVAADPYKQNSFHVQNNVVYCKGDKTEQRWRAMLPAGLENKVFKYVHYTLGHVGVDKCLEEIKYVFHVTNIGRKLRKFIACCDICQRNKHPNRSFTVEEKHHLPEKPGDVCALDIYGSLPTSRGGVKYILVCLDVFSKFKLYPLKAATTKACLNKLITHYFVKVTTPKLILSDNATQFSSPKWTKQLQELKLDFLQFDILNQIRVRDICERYQSVAGYTVAKTTRNGLNFCLT